MAGEKRKPMSQATALMLLAVVLLSCNSFTTFKESQLLPTMTFEGMSASLWNASSSFQEVSSELWNTSMGTASWLSNGMDMKPEEMMIGQNDDPVENLGAKNSSGIESWLPNSTNLKPTDASSATVERIMTPDEIAKRNENQDRLSKMLSIEDQQSKLPPVEVVDLWKSNLESKNLLKSSRHHAKFHSKKHMLFEEVPAAKLVPAETWTTGASRLSKDYSYLHVWKCGGTTVAYQTGEGHYAIGDPKIRATNYFITFVRDPIDHFFSGWSECRGRRDATFLNRQARFRKGMGIQSETVFQGRIFRNNKNMTDMQRTWNRRLEYYLYEAKHARQNYKAALCSVHSFPQINYFLAPEKPTYLLPVAMVGELKEMSSALNLIDGFQFNSTIKSGRNSTEENVEKRYIPPLKEWLTTELLVEICEFVALDYLFFDFEPPKECTFVKDENYHLRDIDYQKGQSNHPWLLSQTDIHMPLGPVTYVTNDLAAGACYFLDCLASQTEDALTVPVARLLALEKCDT